ncbi:MAG: SUMF1/EgtB/PvdO family nonheme iron enzyme [Candidatus Marinimicrobia bacterium]|nr:SUMF1/EgtB/PvdO family nonheme iron enzyme [Candidatus Neomarinimicrobiota bacterium]
MNCYSNQKVSPPVQMVFITGGTFEMGDIWNEGTKNELPVHTVTLNNFEISATGITNQQYVDYLTEALAKGEIKADSSIATGPWNGSGNYVYLKIDHSHCLISYMSGLFSVNDGKENHPVTCVSWYGATAFGFRLPTEAEWEYAARGISAGEDTMWSGTSNEKEISEYTWHFGNSDGDLEPEEVATKLPNANGLYDMSGNVLEWCSDWYMYNPRYYESSPTLNPRGPESGTKRISRGGNAFCNILIQRCSFRFATEPFATTGGHGIRIAKTP